MFWRVRFRCVCAWRQRHSMSPREMRFATASRAIRGSICDRHTLARARCIQPDDATAIADTGTAFHGICRKCFMQIWCPRNNQRHDNVYDTDQRRSTPTLITARVRQHRNVDAFSREGTERRCAHNSRIRQHMYHAACGTRCAGQRGCAGICCSTRWGPAYHRIRWVVHTYWTSQSGRACWVCGMIDLASSGPSRKQ